MPSSTTASAEPAEDPRINEWALDYVGGNLGSASGEPFRIGFVSAEGVDIELASAATEYLNTELDGVGGRPLMLDVCNATGAPTAEQEGELVAPCAARLAADPSIPLVIVGDLFLLDGVFAEAIGTSKPIYVNYGYPALGVSYNPNGVEALAGAAYFIADNLAARFDRLFTVDPVSVSGFFQPVLPEMEVIDVPFWQFGDTTLEQAVTLIAESGATSDDLLYIASPNCAQIVEALGVLELAPTVVAAGGCDNITEEGWYHVNLPWNPSDPDLDTGALTASVKIEEYSGELAPTGIWSFASVLTIAKLINTLGVDAATPDTLRAALLGFTGTAMLARGPANCADQSVLQFPTLGNCATAVSAYLYHDEELIELDPILLGP